MADNRVARINRTCAQCNKAFTVPPSVIKVGKGQFCSAPCRQVADRVSLIERACEICSTAFQVLPSTAQKDAARFCSRTCYYEGRRRDSAEKFWEKVSKTEACWLWNAVTTLNGYGVFRLDSGKNKLAHDVSWLMRNGPIPKGLFVLHDCDRFYAKGDTSYRRCVRPEHLFLGTRHDNMRDCAEKGRTHTKLTADEVREIRRRYAQGVKPSVLSREFCTDKSNVHLIVKLKAWKHIE